MEIDSASSAAVPYVCAKVDLADIIVLEDGVVTGVGGVVSSTVVNGTAGRKRKAWLETTTTKKRKTRMVLYMLVIPWQRSLW